MYTYCQLCIIYKLNHTSIFNNTNFECKLSIYFRGVFTPFACEFRHERIAAIGRDVAKSDYDIVLLQEVTTFLFVTTYRFFIL